MSSIKLKAPKNGSAHVRKVHVELDVYRQRGSRFTAAGYGGEAFRACLRIGKRSGPVHAHLTTHDRLRKKERYGAGVCGVGKNPRDAIAAALEASARDIHRTRAGAFAGMPPPGKRKFKISHPGALTRKAKAAGKSICAFARSKYHARGETGRQSRFYINILSRGSCPRPKRSR